MGKSSKIIGSLFLVLGLACFAMYFVMGDKFSNYKVMFDSDGGTSVKEQIIKKGDKAIKPEDPIKVNSEFVEWRLNNVAYDFDNVVTGDITLTAFWNQVIKHNVKIILEEKEYTEQVRDGETIDLKELNIQEKEGYKIKLYKAISEDTEEKEEFLLTTPVKEDLNLTAEYVEIKTYTVKFNTDGGSKVDDIKVIDGETITSPTTTRDGYIFDGWYLGEEKFDFKTPISKDITLKARWNDGPKINVIFMVDGTVYKTVPTKENTTVTKPADPTKTGHKFKEWQLDGKAFDFKTKITSEITLTALFEEVTSYKVTFNTDGGSSIKSQEVTSKVTKPGNPTKSGHTFVRWELNGKEFDFNTVITEDITLKAIWEQEVIKYTVRFNDDEDKEITTQTVEKGKTAVKPTDPTKDGHRFVEWLYNNEEFNFDTPITQNIILTARFEKIASSTPAANEPVNGENEDNN